MTPAFRHHDAIAALTPGTWLRAIGVLTGHYTVDRHKITPGTLMRVESAGPHRCYVLFDAGDRLVRTSIGSEWFHCLTAETEPPAAIGGRDDG